MSRCIMVNIYTTSFHPENPDEPVPWYEIVENEIYTTLYHPTHPQEPVSLRIVASVARQGV